MSSRNHMKMLEKKNKKNLKINMLNTKNIVKFMTIVIIWGNTSIVIIIIKV